MKVILTADVQSLGPRGRVVEVADGYARNYLIPRGLAIPATEGNVRSLEHRQRMARLRDERQREEAERVRSRLEGAVIVIQAKAGEGGRLYGSVTSLDISRAIREQLGISVDRRRIRLPQGIKALGTYEVEARLYAQVLARFQIRVEEAER